MAAADCAMWLAIKARIGVENDALTSELNTAFLAPAKGEHVYCTARILKMGRRRIYGVAECHGKKGNLFSHHTVTYVRARLNENPRRRCGASRPSSSRRTPRAGTATRRSRARRCKGLAEMGLYGVAIAEEWGGAGLDYTSLAVACEEIAAGDCATATIVAVNNLVAGILAGYGNEQQKEKFLKPLAPGQAARRLRPHRAAGRLRCLRHHHARRAQGQRTTS